MKYILACFLSAVLSGCASTTPEYSRAVEGQTADVVSTVLALSQDSLVEANPAGPIGVVAVKLVILPYVNSWEEPQRTLGLRFLHAIGWGAAAHNMCMLASVLTNAGASLPACLFLVGAPTGVYLFNSTKDSE